MRNGDGKKWGLNFFFSGRSSGSSSTPSESFSELKCSGLFFRSLKSKNNHLNWQNITFLLLQSLTVAEWPFLWLLKKGFFFFFWRALIWTSQNYYHAKSNNLNPHNWELNGTRRGRGCYHQMAVTLLNHVTQGLLIHSLYAFHLQHELSSCLGKFSMYLLKESLVYNDSLNRWKFKV